MSKVYVVEVGSGEYLNEDGEIVLRFDSVWGDESECVEYGRKLCEGELDGDEEGVLEVNKNGLGWLVVGCEEYCEGESMGDGDVCVYEVNVSIVEVK